MVDDAILWMKKKNQKLIYCFIKTLNILKVSIQILGKEHVRVTFHYLIQLFGEWLFFFSHTAPDNSVIIFCDSL